MPTLHDLPLEIAGLVSDYLPRNDLRSIRQLSPNFNVAAARVLFRTINLKVNLPSFDKLAKIAEHDTFHRHVESIYYDGRELDGLNIDKGLVHWIRFTAGSGLNVTEEMKHKIVGSFSESQLQSAYFKYCHYIFGQERLLTDGNEAKLLTNAITRFPRLSSFEYSENSPEAPEELNDWHVEITKSYTEYFPPVVREIVAQPSAILHANENDHFWRFFSAVSSIDAPSLRTIRGSMLEPLSFERYHKTIIPRLKKAMKEVQDVSLEFMLDHEAHKASPALADFLKLATETRRLHISYGDYSSHGYPHEFEPTSVFDHRIHCKHLTTLSLQAMVVKATSLRTFFKRHASTLETLALKDMTFQDDEATSAENGTLGIIDRTQWISMIQFMSESMSLKNVKFEGKFVTGHTEAWVTSGRKKPKARWVGGVQRPMHLPQVPLVMRIENYITQGGACPFRPTGADIEAMEDADEDFHYNVHYSWDWDTDESWRYARELVY